MLQTYKTIRVPFTMGVDETTAASSIPPAYALKMHNFRLSRDGKRIEKRKGLQEFTPGAQDLIPFGEDVYGYTTYYDGSANFCQLAITESRLMRKIAAANWAAIHTWGAIVTHPVRPLEIQDKQFIITEVDSRVVLSNGDDRQIGITAPTTLPTAATTYVDTPPLNELFAYANTAAMDAVWTDGDNGSTSVIATTGPAVQGPDAHAFYARFYDAAPAAGRYARRSKTMIGIKPVYNLEINTYFDTLGSVPQSGHFLVQIDNGSCRLKLYFADSYLAISSTSTTDVIWETVGTVRKDVWQQWKFVVDSTTPSAASIEVYLDGVKLATQYFSYPYTATPGSVILTAYEESTDDGGSCDVYLDNIKVSVNSGEQVSTGTRRYAVTYARGGNFGCESNPIKSVIGAVTRVGTGLNDLTVTGTYTGDVTRKFRVYLQTAGTPDIIKWSADDGATWSITTLAMTTVMYLPFGIVLNFAATTGHTAADYWTFTCSACSVAVTGQQVTLTAIPVSGDAQVTQRKIYRTTTNGARFYWLATINDNTTTTFIDNLPDSFLGSEMEEDHDLMPNSAFSAWWDNRLWVISGDKLYYSQLFYPEHFDLDARYVDVIVGDQDEEFTQLMPYRDSLYVFKKNQIFIIQKKLDGTYGRYLVTTDIGCVAPWSMVSINNYLMFVSHRGIEIYNGIEVTPNPLSLEVTATMETIDTSKYKYICASQFKDKNEVLFSIPDRTAGSAVTVVYNAVRNAFYTFGYYKVPSCIVQAYNSSKKLLPVMGTRDGYLCLCETGYVDGTATVISAEVRKPWISLMGVYADWKRVDIEYEIPLNMTLTLNVYINYDKDVQRTKALTGFTPSATDIEMRRIIKDFAELGLNGEALSIGLTNAENLGGDLKINSMTVYYEPRTIKDKVYGD